MPETIKMFAALGNNTRFDLLQWLATEKDWASLKDMETRSQLDPQTLRYHLKILMDLYLVRCIVSQRGKKVYQVNLSTIAAVADRLNTMAHPDLSD